MLHTGYLEGYTTPKGYLDTRDITYPQTSVLVRKAPIP